MAERIVQRKSFAFAIEIVQLYRQLCEERASVLSTQVLRMLTSIVKTTTERNSLLNTQPSTRITPGENNGA